MLFFNHEIGIVEIDVNRFSKNSFSKYTEASNYANSNTA